MEEKKEDTQSKTSKESKKSKVDEVFLEDEFSNNEFMDGLDVLDSWDESQQKSEERKESRGNSKEKVDKTKSEDHRRRRSRSGSLLTLRLDASNRRRSPGYRGGSPHRRGISPYRRGRASPFHRADSPLRRADSPFRRGNSPPRRGRYYHSPSFKIRDRSYSPRNRRDRSPYTGRDSYEKERYRDYRKSRHSNERKRSREKNYMEERRDPNKTRSDIQRDKDKCQRLKEAKEFEKKVQVAETGLCPPGMEDMLEEVENSSFILSSKKSESAEVLEVINSPVEELKRKSSEDRFSDRREKKSSRIRSTSRDRYRFHYQSKDRFSDNHRGARERSWNRKSPSPDQKRRKRSPFLHELARTLCKNAPKEPYHRKITPTHSNFNQQRFGNMNTPYGDSKIPSSVPHSTPEFVQAMPTYSVSNQVGPICPPTPNIPPLGPVNVNDGGFNFPPVPQPFQPVPDPFQPVSQSFQPLGPAFPQIPQPVAQPQNFPMMEAVPGFQPVPEPVPSVTHSGLPQPFIGPNNPPPFQDSPLPPENLPPLQSPAASLQKAAHVRNRPNLKDISQQSLQISKLFEDKKISLSDFLAVSAKGEIVADNIQEKIKVISRCQDAIKVLENTSKLSSRFFPRFTPAADSEKDKMVRSAESKWKSPLKRAAVVKFSFTTPAKRKENEVQINMKRLLATIGLIAPSVNAAPVRTLKASEELNPSPSIQMRNIFMQTDPYECPVCEIRNARKFADIATQTTVEYLDEATQVLPTDLLSIQPPRGILKNSISHLTAAQLREQEKPSNPAPKMSEMSTSYNPNQFQSSPSKSWQKPEPLLPIKPDIPETIFNPFNGGAMKPPVSWPVWQDSIPKPNPMNISNPMNNSNNPISMPNPVNIPNPSVNSGGNTRPSGPWQPPSNPNNVNINASNANMPNSNMNNWKSNKKNKYRGGRKNKNKKKNLNLRQV